MGYITHLDMIYWLTIRARYGDLFFEGLYSRCTEAGLPRLQQQENQGSLATNLYYISKTLSASVIFILYVPPKTNRSKRAGGSFMISKLLMQGTSVVTTTALISRLGKL